MRKIVFGVATLFLTGCGLTAFPSNGAQPFAKACKTCGKANKVSDAKCGDDKCFATVKEPVLKNVSKPVYGEVEKECYVTEKRKVVTKVPVKTYRIVEEWVDSPVKEAYYETVKVRAKAKVPVTDEYFRYAKVDGKVEKKVNCPKTIRTEKDECRPVRINDTIVRYDKCGKVEELPISREGHVTRHVCNCSTENAVCTLTVNGKVEQPEFYKDDVRRNGYYTKEIKVKKYRTVPGKVLRKRRVCDTVMIDQVNWVEEKRPVIRKITEQTGETIEKKVEYVKREVQVDCITGAPVTQADKMKAETPEKGADKDAAPAQAQAQTADTAARS